MNSKKQNNDVLEQQIAQYIHYLDPAVLGLPVQPELHKINVSRMARGESNMQFLVEINKQHYVVRMGLRRGNRIEAVKEFALLQAAVPLQIAPYPYYFDATCAVFPSDITIMGWIDGKHLTQKELHKQTILQELTELLAKLHCSDILRSALEPYCTIYPDYRSAARVELLGWAQASYRRLARFRRAYGLQDDALMQLLRQGMQREQRRLEEAQCLNGTEMATTHGDIHIGNLLRQHNNILRLIDWETASIQDPAFEFISLFTWEDFTLEEEQFVIDTYQELTGLEHIHERTSIYQAVYLFGVVLDTALRAYLVYAGEFNTDPGVARSIGFYQRDFFICLRNYLNWYTEEKGTTIHKLQQLGQITPGIWERVDPSQLRAIDSSNDLTELDQDNVRF